MESIKKQISPIQDLFVGQKPIPAMQFGIEMGGISFTQNGVTAHITADGEMLNDKQAQLCDSCYEPFAKIDMIPIVDDRLIICKLCYLKHIRRD